MKSIEWWISTLENDMLQWANQERNSSKFTITTIQHNLISCLIMLAQQNNTLTPSFMPSMLEQQDKLMESMSSFPMSVESLPISSFPISVELLSMTVESLSMSSFPTKHDGSLSPLLFKDYPMYTDIDECKKWISRSMLTEFELQQKNMQ